jgi:hypothetical protein
VSYLYKLTCHIHSTVVSYLYRHMIGHICTDLRGVIFAQTYEGSYLYRITRGHIWIDLCVIFVQTYGDHICIDLRVIFVQTYEGSYLYRLTRGHICTDLRVIIVNLRGVIFVQTYERSYLHRLTWGHICTDLRGVISVQTYLSYLYRLTCHICINLRVIFTPQFSILNSIDIFDIKSPRFHGVTQWFHYIIIFLPCRV